VKGGGVYHACGSAIDSPGAGLGSSLVEAVAKLHRGELWLSDNRPGLHAVITLPRAES
jgi:signal transduction histidine kinase